LVYRQLKTGDRIIDFSYAGYGGGGVALPIFPSEKQSHPPAKTTPLQFNLPSTRYPSFPSSTAYEALSSSPAGHFHCNATLKLNADGIVLRGSGSSESDTVLEMTGDPHMAISVAGESSVKSIGTQTEVSDTYVPSGSLSLSVRDPPDSSQETGSRSPGQSHPSGCT